MNGNSELLSTDQVLREYSAAHRPRLMALELSRLGILPEEIENIEVPPEREMTDID